MNKMEVAHMSIDNGSSYLIYLIILPPLHGLFSVVWEGDHE
jgi:hypothetical protein